MGFCLSLVSWEYFLVLLTRFEKIHGFGKDFEWGDGMVFLEERLVIFGGML
jgi:hypothetical protein